MIYGPGVIGVEMPLVTRFRVLRWIFPFFRPRKAPTPLLKRQKTMILIEFGVKDSEF